MTSPRTRTSRLVALTAGLAVTGVVLAGCSATNPMTTEREYSASDGVRVTLGDVRGSNLIVVSEGEGEPGRLIGAFINDGNDDQTVTVTFANSDTSTVELAPHQTVLLDGTGIEDGHATVETSAVDVPPGGTTDVTVATGTAGSKTLQVPVLDGTFSEYATDVPTPTPTPTETATATATPTPTATS